MAQLKRGKDDGVVEKTTENNRPSGGFWRSYKNKKTKVKRIICSIKVNSLRNFGRKIHKCRFIHLWIKIVQLNDNIRKKRLMIIKSN